MSRIFPKDSRRIAGTVLLGVSLLGALASGAVWYYGTPKYTRVGYTPLQPIAFSHALHAGQLGMDCLYCHTNVKEAPHASIPAAQTCMNCHDATKANIKADSPALAPLREAYASGRPVQWVRVHKLPDFVYFNHAVHVSRGVSCVSCHGRIDQMEQVRHEQLLSMSWCLDCHRDPGPNLRPAGRVTEVAWNPAQDWKASDDPLFASESQGTFAMKAMRQSGVHPPTNCSGCHR